jgi:hypothetical protein
MLITRMSPFSKVEHTLDLPITEHQWHCYNTGKSSVQICFPHLTADEREFIRTGLMPEEQDMLYSEGEE